MSGRTSSKRSNLTARDTVVGLLRAADRVRRQISHLVEPHGLTLQQYNVLRILEEAREDGVPTLEVGARMIEETPGVTRLLDRLEAKGFIRRQRCPRDRRQHLCWLTNDGTRLLEQLRPVIAEAHEQALGRLATSERQQAATLFDRIGSAA